MKSKSGIKKTLKNNKNLFIIILVLALILITYCIINFKFEGKHLLVKLMPSIVAFITASGAIVYYYLKNKSEQKDRENARRTQGHSEAQWRKRLFDLLLRKMI